MRRPSIIDAFDGAEIAYDRIRRLTGDVSEIARHTGYKQTNILKVKRHLFLKIHLLDRYPPPYRARFDAHPNIVAAWNRLRTGLGTDLDRMLLRHEIAEAWYMRNVAPGYDRAHTYVQARFPAPEW